MTIQFDGDMVKKATAEALLLSFDKLSGVLTREAWQ